MTRRFWLALCVTGGVYAQPEKEVREAVDRLWAAGNYSWETFVEISVNGGRGQGRVARRIPRRTAETVIHGFTMMKERARPSAVFRGTEIAYLLKSGWRHFDDLTDADRREVSGLDASIVSARPQGSAQRAQVPLLPHTMLRRLLDVAVGFRQEGPVIVADLIGPLAHRFTLDDYLRTGIRPGPRAPTANDVPIKVVIWLERGNVTEFAMESTQSPMSTETVKLTDIGTTAPTVDPEAAALFLGTAK